MAIYNGTSARNVWSGTSSADTARGNGGDDTLNGLGGNDSLYGDAGNDGLYGGIGSDRIWGGTGIDALSGQDGDDQLYGEAGDDYMLGGKGNDYLHGGSGNDRLRGEDGNDNLHGGGGDDNLLGGAGTDTLTHYGRGSTSVPGGKAFYDGGTSTDTLLVDVRGSVPIDIVSEDRASVTFVNLNADGSGVIYYATDPHEYSSVDVATFTGIENFKLADDSNTVVFSARKTTTVAGSNGRDWLDSYKGNQTLNGGGGDDVFRFWMRPDQFSGNDKITGFNKADDSIVYNANDEDYSGPALTKTTAVESNGHTIYTTKSIATGAVIHTLDVDTVGLPPVAFVDFFFT